MIDAHIDPPSDHEGDRLERELDEACQQIEKAALGAGIECEARPSVAPGKVVTVSLWLFLFDDVSPDALVSELALLSESLRLHLANARSMGRKI